MASASKVELEMEERMDKKVEEEGESVANLDSLLPEAACQSDRCCVEGMGGSGYGNGLAGFGPMMKAYYKGKWRSIHDGGGLGSPGRWPPKRRRPLREKEGKRVAAKVKTLFLKWVAGVERDKQGGTKALFWELAAGRHHQSPFTKDMEKYRKELDEELLEMGLKPKRRGGDRDTEIQFRRLMAMMEATGDEDWEFLDQMASEGVSLGVDEVMPRTPKVFEEKQKWAREFVDYLLEDQFSENYASAEESHEDIKRQVKEEVDNGSIVKLPEEEAKARFKGRLAVAALGAVPKELGSDKVRLIHDGSYSVDINRRIKVLDRMRFPLCDDAAAVLAEIEEEVRSTKVPRASLLYDISRAHKLIPILERDWGLQAFRMPGPPDGQIYLHTRGTFGVASAAYYWQRVAAGMIRTVHRLAGGELGVYHLLFADDGWLTSVGFHYWRGPLFWLFVMELMEFPVSWKKVRGGLEVQWIGYQINVDSFARGISEKKVKWVQDWIKRKLQDGGATGREMRSSLGRLSFVAGALHHVRPFLGPIFAWAAMLSPGTSAQFPDAVKILLGYISRQLGGCSMQPARRVAAEPTDVFRIDAKAEGEKIVIGGWESYKGRETSQARWFSIELNRRNAAWAYVKGDPFRSIASLELVGVLTAVMLFAPEAEWRGGRTRVTITAVTDNLGNTFVMQKFASCKFPLSIVVMELACQLRKYGIEMDLGWVPRMQNVPADALTNGEFEQFDPAKRIAVNFEDLKFEVLDELMGKAEELDQEIKLVKSSKEGKRLGDKKEDPKAKSKKGELRWKDPW